MNIELFQERINKKFPQEKLKVLFYTTQKEPSRIKCLNCGEEYELKYAENFLLKHKERVCKKCLPNKRRFLRATKNNFEKFIQNSKNNFILIQSIEEIRSADDKVNCICRLCGKVNSKPMYEYLKNKGCSCQGNNTKYTLKEIQSELAPGFSIIKYEGARENNLYKHDKCGFIFKKNGLPKDKIKCPKCDKLVSIGEKKILNYFEKNNIQYIYQYPQKIKEHLLRFDFYLPKYNIYIEFNGEQHYQSIKYFGGDQAYEEQLERDNLKREFCGKNLIEIPYYDIDKIEDYLVKFND